MSDGDDGDINWRYLRHLRLPMYRLYYIKDPSELGQMPSRDIETFKAEYSPEVQTGIVEAIEWALANSDFDLTDVLPELGHSNDDIRSYLRAVLETLRREGLV